MPSSVRVRDEDRCVEVIHQGSLSPGELYGARAQAARLLGRSDALRLLVDGHDADVSALTLTDVYQFAATLDATLPRARELRIAVVANADDAEQSVFAETVARNRGVNLRVFLDADAARRWLTASNVDAPTRPSADRSPPAPAHGQK